MDLAQVWFLPRLVGMRTLRLVLLLMVASAEPAGAQEFSHVDRAPGRATLTVFDSRPLQRAAHTLAHEFGLRIAAEDPLYLWDGDLINIGRAASGLPLVVPKRLLVETAFDIGADGKPLDVPALVASLTAQVSVERPFDYRVDVGPAGYTIVPTRMRNEEGELVAYVSPLDTVVTLPRTARPLGLNTYAITEAMKAVMGYKVACCTPTVSNFDTTQMEFAVDHESARHALQRLMLLRPSPAVQHMRCQALTRTCFVDWTPMNQGRPRPVPH